ncbi:MAG: AAA family ATPase [Rhabdochlamydiaceae bacterium]
MIIHSLKLQNYRKHKDTFIEFPDGLFGMVGNNGSGKTTIIEAVAYAIYGSHASKTGQELIKREQSDPSSDCKVELEFSLGSDAYRVIRELRGIRQSAYAVLYVNNRSEVEGVYPVTRYLSKKIGMDYKSFFTSIFAKQKELDVLSELTPGDRKKRILRLLGIDRIDTAIENVKHNKKESEARISAVKANLQNIDELNSTVEELEKQKTIRKQKVDSERTALKEAKKDLAKTKKVKDVLERKYSKYQALDKQRHGFETENGSDKRSLAGQQKDLEELEGAKKELQNIKPELKSLSSIKSKKENFELIREKFIRKNNFENQLRRIDDDIKKLKADRKILTLKITQTKNLGSELKAAKKKVAEYITQSNLLSRQIASKQTLVVQFRKQKKEVAHEFEKLKKLGPRGKCTVCKKVIGKEFPDIVKHFTNEIAKEGKKISAATSQIQKLSYENEQIGKLLKESKKEEGSINRLIKQRLQNQQEKKGLDSQIESEARKRRKVLKDIEELGTVKYDEKAHTKTKEIFSELSKLDGTRISLETKIARIPTVKRAIKDLQSAILLTSKKIQKFSDAIKVVGFDNEQYQQAKRIYSDADDAYHKKDKDLINAKNDLSNTLRDINSTLNQISQEKKKRLQIEEEEKKILTLSMLDRIFGDFRLELISRIRPMLSLYSSELFRKLTDGKYPNMIIDENYDIQIEDDGKTFPLERFSGGEEDLASLCLRIAISQVIEQRAGASAINFIALDEIFGSQDESRRNNILKALNDLSTQFRQVIVITHIEDIKDMLPYAFNVVETTDKSSKVTLEGSPKMVLPN